MGKDNLFHKNRERNALDLERKKQERQKQPRILIVCEDSKSSAYYFEDMAKAFGLSAVDVRGKECGSAPSSVLKYAVQEYEQEKSNDQYDRVCIILLQWKFYRRQFYVSDRQFHFPDQQQSLLKKLPDILYRPVPGL